MSRRNAQLLITLAAIGVGLVLASAWQRSRAASIEPPPEPAAAPDAEALHARLRIPKPPPGARPPLTACDVFALPQTGKPPRYLGRILEGNVAPYGVLLASHPDPALARDLIAAARGHRWEYSHGYGPTSTDSALVIEGLLRADASRQVLSTALDRLADEYHDPDSGGFATVTRGRAAYWNGPSVETTALIAYLMQQVAPARFSRFIEASTGYVRAAQKADGHFPGRWFSSRIMPTYQAVRLLVAHHGPRDPAVQRALGFLRGRQRATGSYGGSALETALALLTYDAAGRADDEPARRARQWLARARERGLLAGEPFLHYYFEAPSGERIFFSCLDRGELTGALVDRALAGA